MGYKIGGSGFLKDRLNQNINSQNKISERLSSGKRINKASDDAAGLAISANLEAAISALGKAADNVSYGTSITNVADGALEQISNVEVRMKELALQSSNGTLSDEQRGALNEEYQQLSQEVQRITDTAEFNGTKVFDQAQGTSIQVGTDSSSSSSITLPTLDSTQIIAGGDISSAAGAQAALDSLDSNINAVSAQRGTVGSIQSRLDTALGSIRAKEDSSSEANARIRDADIAKETADFVAISIRSDVATAVNAQANASANTVLQLLK